MPFRPINENHAIESAGFAINLTRPFNQSEWQAIHKNYHNWTHILPAVQFDTNPNLVAIFGFLQPDGNSSWQMSIQDNQIAIVCSQYTRWKNVKAQVIELFVFVTEVLLKLENNMPEVWSFSYEMKDIFIHDDEGTYELDELFEKNTPRLLEKLFKSGKYWHQNIGAFVEWSSDFRCLELLKVSSGQVNDRILVTLIHAQELRLNEGKVLNLRDLMKSGAKRFSSELEKMHIGNKALLQEMLVKDMQKNISLNVEVG